MLNLDTWGLEPIKRWGCMTRDGPLSCFMNLISSCIMYDYKSSSTEVSCFLTAVSTCSISNREWPSGSLKGVQPQTCEARTLKLGVNNAACVCVLGSVSGILHRMPSIQRVSCSLSMWHGSSAVGPCGWQLFPCPAQALLRSLEAFPF